MSNADDAALQTIVAKGIILRSNNNVRYGICCTMLNGSVTGVMLGQHVSTYITECPALLSNNNNVI